MSHVVAMRCADLAVRRRLLSGSRIGGRPLGDQAFRGILSLCHPDGGPMCQGAPPWEVRVDSTPPARLCQWHSPSRAAAPRALADERRRGQAPLPIRFRVIGQRGGCMFSQEGGLCPLRSLRRLFSASCAYGLGRARSWAGRRSRRG